ncbi:MAG: hypothetical protein AABW73_04625 [Nanoarchaeota archaeon]
MIPKVKFKVIEHKKMMPLIHAFMSSKHPWSKSTIHEYPELEKSLAGVSDDKKGEALVNEYFAREYANNLETLNKKSRSFQRSWDKVNDNFMTALSDVVQTPWYEGSQNFDARVSMNPVSPRFLDYHTFDIYHKRTPQEMRELNAHELLHFLYFDKWKKVFPQTPKQEFENPHLVWKLSEMVPHAVLSDPRIQKVIPHQPRVYSAWKKAVIGGRPLLDQLGEIYDSRKDFEDFLRRSYDFVKKHEGEISKIRV